MDLGARIWDGPFGVVHFGWFWRRFWEAFGQVLVSPCSLPRDLARIWILGAHFGSKYLFFHTFWSFWPVCAHCLGILGLSGSGLSRFWAGFGLILGSVGDGLKS